MGLDLVPYIDLKINKIKTLVLLVNLEDQCLVLLETNAIDIITEWDYHTN